MHRVSPSGLSSLMSRFYDFCDGVVTEVQIQLRGDHPRCRIAVEAQDRESPSGWATVVFEVHAPSVFRFEQGHTTFEVMSSGIQVGWRDGNVYLVLDAYPDLGDDLPDLATNIAYVAGAECYWEARAVSS